MPKRKKSPSELLLEIITPITPEMYEEAYGYQIQMQSQRNFDNGLGYGIQKKDGQLVLDTDLLRAALEAVKGKAIRNKINQTPPKSNLFKSQTHS